jgi:hypothetical protein
VPSHLRESWQRYIIPFLGHSAPDAVDADAMRSAERQWVRIHGGGTVGGSVGTLVGAVGMAAAMIAAARAPFGLPGGIIPLFFAPLYWGILVGSALGEVVASRGRVRGAHDDGLTDGEPPRRVSDYRSPLLLLIVALSFLVYSIVTLILAPRYVAFSPDVIREYGIVPPPRWFLAVYPCALLLIVIFAEVCVWIVAKSSAPIRLQNSALAQRFNMGIIRQRMSGIYFMTLVFSPQFAGNGLMLFTSTGHVSESSGWRMGVWLFLFFISYAVGLPIVFTVGRMGGRLTGWPWGNGATRDGAAEERGGGMV